MTKQSIEQALQDAIQFVVDWVQTNFLTPNMFAQWVSLGIGLFGVLLIGRLIGPRYRRWVEETLDNDIVKAIFSVIGSLGHSLAFFLFCQVTIGVFIALDSFPTWVFAASELAISWVIIRVAAYIIPNRTLSRLVASVVWIGALLQILGLLDPINSYLESLTFSVGDTRTSAYGVIKGLIMAAICIQIAALVSRFTARRIVTSSSLSPSLQVLLSKMVNIGLYTVALIFALTSVGLDLTNLTIFSSAIGIGVGFGLRTIFANYISGILLLLDKSIKPGDNIEVGGVYGTVRNMYTRYASVLTRDGKEYLIPNEQLITNEVVNWSYSNTNVRIGVPVGVSYESDLNKVRELMEKAADQVPRILKHPRPAARLAEFGDSSVNLELRFWIADAQEGVFNVRSDVLFAIWNLFQENDIEIPFPQRVVTFKDKGAQPVEATPDSPEASSNEEKETDA